MEPLASLRVVRGQIGTGGYNRELESLAGLERLEFAGELIFFTDGLRDLTGIRNLREVEGFFRLFIMENLTRLDGLERLQSTGRLHITGNPVLVDLDGLSGLEQVNGDLRIEDNLELKSIEGLVKLKRVSGDVVIQNNPKVPRSQIDALTGRIEIGGTLHVE